MQQEEGRPVRPSSFAAQMPGRLSGRGKIARYGRIAAALVVN